MNIGISTFLIACQIIGKGGETPEVRGIYFRMSYSLQI